LAPHRPAPHGPLGLVLADRLAGADADAGPGAHRARAVACLEAGRSAAVDVL